MKTKTNNNSTGITRRGCGFGSVVTTCRHCGRLVIGHNRGCCTNCTCGHNHNNRTEA